MGRETGVNGGRGGAGFFADPDHGFLGESGIVGAGVPIGVGSALAARYDGSGRVAVAAFGDGALNQGAVHEAMNFAAVYQPAGGVRVREQRLRRVHADRVDVPRRAAGAARRGVRISRRRRGRHRPARRPGGGARSSVSRARGWRADPAGVRGAPARRPPYARPRALPPGRREGGVGRPGRPDSQAACRHPGRRPRRTRAR